jgi:hypothetical protein
MKTVIYSSTKKKRQPLAKLASEATAPSEVSGSIVAECPPTVKRRRGRPKLPEGQARSLVLPIRLNKEEYSLIQEAAKKSGQDPFQWMREQLLLDAVPF